MLYNALWTLCWLLVTYSCPQVMCNFYLSIQSLTVVHRVFTELLGSYSCHHCPVIKGYGPRPLATLKPDFNTHLLFNHFEILHICTTHSTLSADKIRARSLQDWRRYHTFPSLSSPNIDLVSLLQFLHDHLRILCVDSPYHNQPTVQKSCWSHQPIFHNLTFLSLVYQNKLAVTRSILVRSVHHFVDHILALLRAHIRSFVQIVTLDTSL